MTRIGVFSYVNSDGTIRRELRHPDDVFAPESLASLSMIPVTAEHPNELVNADNSRNVTVGTTGEKAERDNRFVKSTIQVQDSATIKRVDQGDIRELSCGYTCNKDGGGVTDGIPGIPDGLEYDVRQTNILYNHVALTSQGRAGPECAVPRMDGMDEDTAVMVTDSSTVPITPRRETTMKATIRIDGIGYETSEQAAQAFKNYDERSGKETADLRAKVEDTAKELEKEKARADAAEESAKKAKEERTDALKPEAIQKAVKARVSLEQNACKALGEKTQDGKDRDFGTMSDLELKTAVIKFDSPDCNLDDKSDVYIDARYDRAVEGLAKSEKKEVRDSRQRVRQAATDDKTDKVYDAASAREKMLERQANAWKREDQKSN